MSERTKQPSSIGDQVDRLFREVLHPSGSEYSYSEVAAATKLDASYLRRLRLGQIPNPGIQSIEALCRFFGVDSAYFMPDLARERGHESETNSPSASFRVALRATGLTAEAQEYVEGLVMMLQRTTAPAPPAPVNEGNGDAPSES